MPKECFLKEIIQLDLALPADQEINFLIALKRYLVKRIKNIRNIGIRKFDNNVKNIDKRFPRKENLP